MNVKGTARDLVPLVRDEVYRIAGEALRNAFRHAQAARIEVQRQQWNGWWRGGWVSHTVDKDSGIIVARGLLTITLKDRAGTEYESVDVEAKGLGVSEFQAENKLKEDFRGKLEKTFGKWLENLVK